MFSLNFSSAGKGPFMAGEVKNMHQRHNFLGGGGRGGWTEGHGPTLAEKFRSQVLGTSFPDFKTYFMQLGHCRL